MQLHVLTCGGTIDKVYFDASSAFHVGEPRLPHVFQQVGVQHDVRLDRLMRKDSLEMTDADRAAVREAVQTSSEPYILITHGTDTMVETAKALGNIGEKRVVFTGAMQPALMRESDAAFNVGFALGVLLTGPLGPNQVFIAMNGQAFEADQVRKNKQAGRFEAL